MAKTWHLSHGPLKCSNEHRFAMGRTNVLPIFDCSLHHNSCQKFVKWVLFLLLQYSIHNIINTVVGLFYSDLFFNNNMFPMRATQREAKRFPVQWEVTFMVFPTTHTHTYVWLYSTTCQICEFSNMWNSILCMSMRGSGLDIIVQCLQKNIS